MLEKIKQINPSLPGMILVDIVYLFIGEIIIIAFVPWKRVCALGFLAGVLYSVFASFHLSFKIRQVVFGGERTSKTLVLGYLVRLLVMLLLFAALYYFKLGDLVCAIIGMFSMKVAAYLGPVTDRLFQSPKDEEQLNKKEKECE